MERLFLLLDLFGRVKETASPFGRGFFVHFSISRKADIYGNGEKGLNQYR